MATSTIGKPVVLMKETGKRMAEICARPARKAITPGQPLKLSSAPIVAAALSSEEEAAEFTTRAMKAALDEAW